MAVRCSCAGPIKDVEVGDVVVATDPEEGKTTGKSVTRLYDHLDTDLADVTVTDRRGVKSILHTTQGHPFWDATTASWTPAGSLRPGDRLSTPTGTATATVAGVRSFSVARHMLNLTVAGIHTYYVLAGTTPVLGHNACDPMISVIGEDSFLTKAAEKAGRNENVQREMDSLSRQLRDGNIMNPGLGTKSLGGTDVLYARGRNGARLFFRNVDGGIQIVGKADKDNESTVIKRLTELYGR